MFSVDFGVAEEEYRIVGGFKVQYGFCKEFGMSGQSTECYLSNSAWETLSWESCPSYFPSSKSNENSPRIANILYIHSLLER